MKIPQEDLEQIKYVFNNLKKSETHRVSIHSMKGYDNENRDFFENEFRRIALLVNKLGIADFKDGKQSSLDQLIHNDETLITDIDSFFEEKIEQSSFEKIETENATLTNASLKHQSTIKEQTQRITDLTEENLKLQNRSLKRELIIFAIGLIVGGIFSNLPDILKYVSSQHQQKNQPHKVPIDGNSAFLNNSEQIDSITNQKETNTTLKNDKTTKQ
jgi:hypothetical protein